MNQVERKTEDTMTLREKLDLLLAGSPNAWEIRIMAKTALVAGDYELACALREIHDGVRYQYQNND